MNNYTSEKYKHFTVATNRNNHLLFFYRHRGEQNIIYCLGYHYPTNNLFKQQILLYNIKNFPLKITEPRYFSKISWKLRFQPIERLNELL